MVDRAHSEKNLKRIVDENETDIAKLVKMSLDAKKEIGGVYADGIFYMSVSESELYCGLSTADFTFHTHPSYTKNNQMPSKNDILSYMAFSQMLNAPITSFVFSPRCRTVVLIPIALNKENDGIEADRIVFFKKLDGTWQDKTAYSLAEAYALGPDEAILEQIYDEFRACKR